MLPRYAHTWYCLSIVCLTLLPPPASAQDLRQTVSEFLRQWYVHKNFEGAAKFTAKYNAFRFGLDKGASPSEQVDSVWKELFSEAFTNPSAHFDTLGQAIGYSIPSRVPKGRQIRYLNLASNGSLLDPYAVIDPSSLPDGLLFPRKSSTAERRDRLANFLEDLREKYAGQLYIVVYTATGEGLLHETGILYWIREGNSWKLAAYQGTI